MSGKPRFEEEEVQESQSQVHDSFIREFLQFMWERKLWWMLPLLLVLVLIAVLLMLASSSGAASPFIYSIF